MTKKLTSEELNSFFEKIEDLRIERKEFLDVPSDIKFNGRRCDYHPDGKNRCKNLAVSGVRFKSSRGETSVVVCFSCVKLVEEKQGENVISTTLIDYSILPENGLTNTD